MWKIPGCPKLRDEWTLCMVVVLKADGTYSLPMGHVQPPDWSHPGPRTLDPESRRVPS